MLARVSRQFRFPAAPSKVVPLYVRASTVRRHYVEFGKPVSPELVDLRLDEAAVAIGIEGPPRGPAAAA